MEIADYGFLSDCNTAALVSRDATIEWYCPHRFDAPSVFGRMLDADAGHWALRPEGGFRSERSYVDDTLVLCTRFTTETGVVQVTDALVFEPGSRGHDIGREVPHVLARVVRGLEGEVSLSTELRPRFDYAMTVPRFARVDGSVEMRRGPVTLRLRADGPLTIDGDRASATFMVEAGDEVGFTLGYGQTFSDIEWPDLAAGSVVADTIAGWRSWVELHHGYEGRHADLVRRSAIVLHGLSYQPSGAVAAAATTSLPERIGGDDNYDYRFTWLRDLSMTLEAQWVAACPDEASRFFAWLTAATGNLEDGRDPQIMYGLGGEQFLTEETLDHLAGFEGSRPVRVGNAAWRQRQLDVMGEILNAAHLLRDQLRPFEDDTRRMLVALADHAAARWEEPDAGMWEARDRHRPYVTSKVLCWVALDRAIRLVDDLDAGDHVDHWREVRERIHATVLEEAWSEETGAFAGAFGSDRLDASVLLMPIVGFLPADDARMRATIDRIEEELSEDWTVRRWRDEPGGFLLTAFWLVECLALAGDVDRAEAWFERTVDHANDLGLMSEEVEPGTGRLTGNFPQAFSHVGLVNAAWRLTRVASEDDGLDQPDPPS